MYGYTASGSRLFVYLVNYGIFFAVLIIQRFSHSSHFENNIKATNHYSRTFAFASSGYSNIIQVLKLFNEKLSSGHGPDCIEYKCIFIKLAIYT